jgi:hypothetical protein
MVQIVLYPILRFLSTVSDQKSNRWPLSGAGKAGKIGLKTPSKNLQSGERGPETTIFSKKAIDIRTKG